ncbi:MAG: hypothetical protein SFV22_13780 [Saprospiraceae bacterium]|nr:hypothetical protein [Saprospiraceae bacterium]
MRLYLIALSFLVIFDASAQPRLNADLPLSAYYLGIDSRSFFPKQTVDSLIDLHDNPNINDTTRIEIIYQLSKYECARTVEFLLENVDRYYRYGIYNMDEYYEQQNASYWTLIKIAMNPDRGWYLFPHLLYSLKQEKNRGRLYYVRLSRLLARYSNREAAISIIENEITRDLAKERIPFSRSIYVDNLNLILKTIEEDR